MKHKFDNFKLKEKQISEKKLNGYRVYSDKSNFQTVESETVAEAIDKSGIKEPYKIEVVGLVKKSIFTESELIESAQTNG